MKILVACEFSGVVREAFKLQGHDAWSCDLLPTEQPGNHIQVDVLSVLNDGWDLMIAHPPCQYLSYAGTHCWNQPGREEKRQEAMQFFMALINAPIARIAVENPRGVPGKLYRKPDQEIHPYYFGDAAMKRTCLWLKNLPKLVWWEQDSFFSPKTMTDRPKAVYATQREDGIKLRHFTEASHGNLNRARTFRAIARAMAEQWGVLSPLKKEN